MARLTKDQILKARNANGGSVHVEELGGEVGLRLLSMRESNAFAQESDGMSGEDATLLYAAYLIADDAGNRMFDDYRELADLPAKTLMRITAEGNKLNGISDDEIEAEAKNS